MLVSFHGLVWCKALSDELAPVFVHAGVDGIHDLRMRPHIKQHIREEQARRGLSEMSVFRSKLVGIIE